jgi:hypothetical protein
VNGQAAVRAGVGDVPRSERLVAGFIVGSPGLPETREWPASGEAAVGPERRRVRLLFILEVWI